MDSGVHPRFLPVPRRLAYQLVPVWMEEAGPAGREVTRWSLRIGVLEFGV